MEPAEHLMFQLRATRQRPPGRGAEPERKGVFNAALAQFDELMRAARAAGPASRPLLLFYALSQASRALSAAINPNDRWLLRGHGLQAGRLDVDLGDLDLHAHGIRPRRDKETGERSISSFGGVLQLAGDRVRADWSVSLGALWAALPEPAAALNPEAAPGVPRPAWLQPHELMPRYQHLEPDDHFRFNVALLPGDGDPLDALLEYLPDHAPEIDYWRPIGVPRVVLVRTQRGDGVQFIARAKPGQLRDPAARLAFFRRIAPDATDAYEGIWLRPRVDGHKLSTLSTWWALLYGLSMVARYEPQRWLETLDLAESPWAAPVQWLLEYSLDEIPSVLAQVIGRQADAT